MRTFLFLIFILNYSQNIFSQTETSIDTIYKQDNVAISYLFRAKYQNFTYFFYVKDNSLVEILRFDIEKRQWFADGYRTSPSLTSEKL